MSSIPQHELRHAVVTMAPDEQSVTVGGYRFAAVEGSDPGACKGCAFIDGFSCSLWRKKPAKGSMCMPQQRMDQRSIIWVRNPLAEARP